MTIDDASSFFIIFLLFVLRSYHQSTTNQTKIKNRKKLLSKSITEEANKMPAIRCKHTRRARIPLINEHPPNLHQICEAIIYLITFMIDMWNLYWHRYKHSPIVEPNSIIMPRPDPALRLCWLCSLTWFWVLVLYIPKGKCLRSQISLLKLNIKWHGINPVIIFNILDIMTCL